MQDSHTFRLNTRVRSLICSTWCGRASRFLAHIMVKSSPVSRVQASLLVLTALACFQTWKYYMDLFIIFHCVGKWLPMVPNHTPAMWIKVRSEDCIQFSAWRQRRVLTITVKGVSKNSGLETDESSRIPLNPHTGHLEGNHLIVWEPYAKEKSLQAPLLQRARRVSDGPQEEVIQYIGAMHCSVEQLAIDWKRCRCCHTCIHIYIRTCWLLFWKERSSKSATCQNRWNYIYNMKLVKYVSFVSGFAYQNKQVTKKRV